MASTGFVDISSKEELASWQTRILQLFEITYGRPLPASEWEWFYLRNPIGPAQASLYVEDGHLLGHYATIPTLLRHGNMSVCAHRSMTTMVHPKAQGRGVFRALAQRVYERLELYDVPLVYGFPNQNSARTFHRSLGWTLPAADLVVDLTGKQIQNRTEVAEALTAGNGLRWDMDHTSQRHWRLARPDVRMVYKDGLMLRWHNGRKNILYIDQRGLRALDPDVIYRVLIPNRAREHLSVTELAFEYQFGYRQLSGPSVAADFHRELVLSDVF